MFNFSRRINRATYFSGQLISVVGALIILAIIGLASEDLLPRALANCLYILSSLGVVALLFYSLCLTRQRANDISGEYALLYTFLGFFILGWLTGIIPGQKRTNRYGAQPKKGVRLK